MILAQRLVKALDRVPTDIGTPQGNVFDWRFKYDIVSKITSWYAMQNAYISIELSCKYRQ